MELVTSAGDTLRLSSGHSVGNKRIDVLAKPVEDVVKARLTILKYEGDADQITRFAVFPECPTA